MSRRITGTLRFSYLVEQSEYEACPTPQDMAAVDQELMIEDWGHLLHFLGRSDVVDLVVEPAVALVEPRE